MVNNGNNGWKVSSAEFHGYARSEFKNIKREVVDIKQDVHIIREHIDTLQAFRYKTIGMAILASAIIGVLFKVL